MLTIDIQALTHPHVGEMYVLKVHFYCCMQICDSKRNRQLPLPVLPLPPQRYIDQDTVMNHALAAAYER